MWVKIPGLAEAIKRENDIRDAAFLDLTTDICGIAIRQMTPRDLLILDGIGNPLIAYQFPSLAQLVDFLWKLSPEFKLHAPLRRFLFGRRCRKVNYLLAVRAIFKYLDATFQDSPASSGDPVMQYAGWPAYLITNLSDRPVADEQLILNTPFKRLFQYQKCLRRKNNPDAPMHNPSDKCKGDYLRKVNLENARAKLIALLKRRAN